MTKRLTGLLPSLPPTPSCPQCQTLLKDRQSVCPVCGLNVAYAAALVEREVLEAVPLEPLPLAETTLPRFGEFLRDNGHITEAQLQAGLARQRALQAEGRPETIGQVLLGMGALSRGQLDQAGIQHVQLYQRALRNIIQQLEQHVQERTHELRDALERVAELNVLKANFVANVSHELRTPLVPVRGYLGMLRDGVLGPVTEPQQQALAAMQQSVARLEGLINELIQFASGEKGQLHLTPTLFSLGDLLQRLMRHFRPRAEAAGLRLELDTPAELPMLTADGEKLHWALFQLVDNALKFTGKGGAVRLSAEVRPGSVRLAVSDTGIGIPPDRLHEIFEPFHKLSEGSGERLYAGTGLGLALVRRVVEAHSSRVQVTSTPGQGSVFAFELPYAISG